MARQIAIVEKDMTATQAGGRTLSSSFSAFDKARLDQDWAEKYYTTVSAGLERARVELERQQVYVDTFVQPTLPEQAEYPRRLWNILLAALASFVAWAAVAYVKATLLS